MRLKERYPWRVGAPSFVFPDDIQGNVRRLAPLVDDVQLLFFESADQSELDHPLDLVLLAEMAAEYNLSYTVHLPIDLQLGSSSPAKRQAGLAEIIRLAELLAPLNPICFDLHLLPEADLAESFWLDNLDSSLMLLAREFAENRKLICVENCEYPFYKVKPLVLDHGLSLCLDFGHALRYGADLDLMLADITAAGHIHYHGFNGVRDHQAISVGQNALSADLAATMSDSRFCGVVTIEVYSPEKLTISMKTLAGAWNFPNF